MTELQRFRRFDRTRRPSPQPIAAVVTRGRAAWRTFSAATQVGLVTILLGGFGDALAHSLGPPASVGSFTPPQQAGHLVVLIGMVISLAGILIPALRLPLRRRRFVSHQL